MGALDEAIEDNCASAATQPPPGLQASTLDAQRQRLTAREMPAWATPGAIDLRQQVRTSPE